MSNTQRLIEQGYGPVLDRIPDIVSAGRLAFNTNDVACYFHEKPEGVFRGVARPRADVIKSFRETLAPFYPGFVERLELDMPVPQMVAVLLIGIRRATVLHYLLEGLPEMRVLS